MTDAGRLQGEIALGYYAVRRTIEDIEGFPPASPQAVLHIILSHHGALEHGSPVVPCTREATLVHMIDNLGGRLGSFDRLEKELADGQQWSAFDRALGSGAYFAAARSRLTLSHLAAPRGVLGVRRAQHASPLRPCEERRAMAQSPGRRARLRGRPRAAPAARGGRRWR